MAQNTSPIADLPFVQPRRSTPASDPTERTVQSATRLAVKARRLDPITNPPDPDVCDRLPPEFCIEHRVLPWGRLGQALLVGTAHEGDRTQLRDMLEHQLGPILFGDASEADIHDFVTARHADRLAELAERQVPDDLSCRDINKLTWRRGIMASLFFGVCIGIFYVFPNAFFVGITAVAVTNLIACLIFKICVFLAGYKKPPKIVVDVPLSERPVVSLMVPMFREAAIANTLVQRLSRLTYPKSLLDVVLVLETKDTQTRQMLAAQSLPSWMRVIEVPDADLKTKPRALNYALKYTRGDIIGILDAEDAPATDQIERVVDAFHAAPKDVVCAQGILDFYNPHANWVSRCFTIEYATWFRIVLAGAARLGFPIPLGGTTVFIRRFALQHVGGWDAHNVTEDADLGIRLARFGYKTILLPTVTREEANNRVIPWIKQRSRWLKGYMITYRVHMRRPWRLLKDLGPRKFLGFQFFFLTTILQFTLAPALWSFWLVCFGIATPFTEILPNGVTGGLLGLFLFAELVSLLIGFVAVARTQHDKLMQWVPMMMFYFPLGVFAVYKALSELVIKPFYWDKTQHGVSEPDVIGGDIHTTHEP
ncbi:glycosyltransferase [Marivita sp. S6314]|uniref:glycosyltransferase family 2 protein n=1 Tax=Marivita sp. S6314 TaxID=2926406 RepID=UPI001FF6E4B4|nr:glycosyltransferase family 2 protein [Marivita sp. S6314]MCK0149353.1 glycosyltransferase [Marivita sp. S6314]